MVKASKDGQAEEISLFPRLDEDRTRDLDQLQILKDDYAFLHQRTDNVSENIKSLQPQIDNFQQLLQKLKTLLDDINLLRQRSNMVQQNLKLSQEQDKRLGQSKEHWCAFKEVNSTINIESSDVNTVQSIGEYKYVDNRKYVLNKYIFNGREPSATDMKMLPGDPEVSTAFIPSGVMAGGVIPFAALPPSKPTDEPEGRLKTHMKFEESGKGLRVILQIPRFDKIELQVYTEADSSEDPYVYYMQNDRIWEVTFENVQKVVGIAINSPGHSKEVLSVLRKTAGETATEIQRNYPKAHIIEPFKFTSTFTKGFELGMMRDMAIISDTKANIELVICIACWQHDMLPKVSAHLDKLRLEAPKP